MSAPILLQDMLAKRQVRLGSTVPRRGAQGLPTGLHDLDELIPEGGWPHSGLAEVLVPFPGSGELDLVMPTIGRLTTGDRDVAVIGTTLIPYAPAWRARGVVLERLYVVDAAGADVPWAAEQCVRSGHFAAVFVWLERASDHVLRRLSTAAGVGSTLVVLIRELRAHLQASPAVLRLALHEPRVVTVLKCRGANAPSTRLRLHDMCER